MSEFLRKTAHDVLEKIRAKPHDMIRGQSRLTSMLPLATAAMVSEDVLLHSSQEWYRIGGNTIRSRMQREGQRTQPGRSTGATGARDSQKKMTTRMHHVALHRHGNFSAQSMASKTPG